jgi:phosphoglycerate kinase
MREFSKYIRKASTVIWNGTLGYAELPQFAQGSSVMAEAISQEHGAVSIVGGGDTSDFVLNWQSQHGSAHFSHISTGGGASLELMSGLKLPGVEALL